MNRKKLSPVFAIVWIAVIIVLFAVVNKFQPGGQDDQVPQGNSAAATPQPADADLAKAWSSIIKQSLVPPLGNRAAKFTIVEFGDFQCPQCGEARTHLEDEVTASHGTMCLYFFNRPLVRPHPFALAAAEAAYIAAEHGRFWPMYDTLYKHQDDLGPSKLPKYAKEAGVDPAVFSSEMASHKFAAHIKADAALCDSLKINGTPSVAVRNNKTGAIKFGIGKNGMVDAFAKQGLELL